MPTDWNHFTHHDVAEHASLVSKGIFERQLYTGWGSAIPHPMAIDKPSEVWSFIWQDAINNKGFTGRPPWFTGFLMWDRPPIEIGSVGRAVLASINDWAWDVNQNDDWPSYYPYEVYITDPGVHMKDATKIERLGIIGRDERNGKMAVARNDPKTWAVGSRIWLVGVPYLEPEDFYGIPIVAEPNKIYASPTSTTWTGRWQHWDKWNAVHVYDFLLQAKAFLQSCMSQPDLGHPEYVWQGLNEEWGYLYPGPQYWCGHKQRIRGYMGYLKGETYYGVYDERVRKEDGTYYSPWLVMVDDTVKEMEEAGVDWQTNPPRIGVHVNNSAYNRSHWMYLEGILSKINCAQYYISPGKPERLDHLMYGCSHVAEADCHYGYGEEFVRDHWVEGPAYAFENRHDLSYTEGGTAWLQSPKTTVPFPVLFLGKVGAFSVDNTLQMFNPPPRDPPYPPLAPEAVYSETESMTTLSFPTRLLKGYLVRGVKKLMLIANVSDVVRPFGVAVTTEDGDTYNVIPEVLALPPSNQGLHPARHPFSGPFYVVKSQIQTDWPLVEIDTPGLTLSASITQAQKLDGSERYPRTSGTVNTGACYSFLDYFVSVQSLYESLGVHEDYYGEYTYCVVRPPFSI